MPKAVEICSLTKDFGTIRALSNLNLSIEEGQVYGLLGPNGSGKITLMKAMVGLVKPSSGKILIYGVDPQRNPIAVVRS